MNCMRGLLREGSVEIPLSKDELDCMKESASSDYGSSSGSDGVKYVVYKDPVNGHGHRQVSPDYLSPNRTVVFRENGHQMNGRQASKNGVMSKKPPTGNMNSRKWQRNSFDCSPDDLKKYEQARNGYYVETVAEIHSFNTPVSPEKPASAHRNDSVTSTEEFLIRKMALQKAKQNGDTTSEMSKSILANEAWYRDQDGRTGFKPNPWKPPLNEQKAVIKNVHKKREEVENKPRSRIEPNFLLSGAPFIPKRESWHFMVNNDSSTDENGYAEGSKSKKAVWVSNRQASLPTNFEDGYCHCDSPMEKTPKFLFNSKTGSIHEVENGADGRKTSSEDETPRDPNLLRRYYGHVWKKISPGAQKAKYTSYEEDSSVSSSNPDETLERQSSTLSISSKASNKSVTFAEEVEINEIEPRRRHDDDSSSESEGGHLVDEQLEQLRKPLGKQDSALDLLEKQLFLLQQEGKRDESPKKYGERPSTSPLKIDIDSGSSSASSSPRHPSGNRISASASPRVYTESYLMPTHVHASEQEGSNLKSWSSEATTVIETQAPSRPILVNLDADSGNSSESPVDPHDQQPTLTQNSLIYENAHRDSSDDDLERKTSLGNPPPGLTLSQWEEMIRSIYLEQTSENAKKTANTKRVLNLSQKSLYPEDVYGPDVYQQILMDQNPPETPCYMVGAFANLNREDTPMPSEFSLSPELDNHEKGDQDKRSDQLQTSPPIEELKIQSTNGYFYLQKSIEARSSPSPIARVTFAETCDIKKPVDQKTNIFNNRSTDNLASSSALALLAPTTNFSSCTSIEQSFYDNVQPESLAMTRSIQSSTPDVKKVTVHSERVTLQDPPIVKKVIRNPRSPSDPASQLKADLVSKYGLSNSKIPLVSPEVLSEDDQRKDPRIVSRKISHDSLLSTDSRESIISATSFRDENKVRRYFNY